MTRTLSHRRPRAASRTGTVSGLAILAVVASLAMRDGRAAGEDDGPPLIQTNGVSGINPSNNVFDLSTTLDADPYFPQAAVLGVGNMGGASGFNGGVGSFSIGNGGMGCGSGCLSPNAGRGFGTGGPLFLPGGAGQGCDCSGDPIGVPLSTPGGGNAGVFACAGLMTGQGSNGTLADTQTLCWDIQAPQIVAATGELILQGTFLRALGIGYCLEFGFTFCSQRTYVGPLGPSLHCPWFAKLIFEEDPGMPGVVQSILHYNGFGRQTRYPVSGTAGVFGPAEGYARKIFANPDGSYTIRDRFGRLQTFAGPAGSVVDNAPPGALLKTEDRSANTVLYLYEPGTQRLAMLRDTLSRDAFVLTYSAQGRLISVQDVVGDRTVCLRYDAMGDLGEVDPPGLEQSPQQTARWRFTWSRVSGGGLPLSTPAMTSVAAPNQASPGAPPSPTQFQLVAGFGGGGQVLGMTRGGTNATGRGAGGSYTVSYQRLISSPPPPGGFETQVAQITTVTDRNGNVTEYHTNANGNVLLKREFTRGLRPGDPASFDTVAAYNSDGLITSLGLSRGNGFVFQYDSANPDPFQRFNMLQVTFGPGGIASDQAQITWQYRYEPFFGRLQSVTEPRGLDASYTPQTGTDPLGRTQNQRYTSTRLFDYQEASGPAHAGLAAYLARFGIADPGVAFFNADLNGDGRFGDAGPTAAQIQGNAIRIDHPTVVLLPHSRQAAIEGGFTQQIRELYAFNDAGQSLYFVDPEGNVHDFLYFQEDLPSGAGVPNPRPTNNIGQPFNHGRAGYRRAAIRDNRGLPAFIVRREGTPFTQIKTEFTYRPEGNVATLLDGRGVRTDFVVNQWNLVNKVTRAADVSAALANPGEQNSGLVAHAYFVQTTYDLNSNVVSRQVENRDSTTGDIGTTVDYAYVYDILDNLIEETAEASVAETLVTRYFLDPNENVIRVDSPLAVAGSHPNNRVATAFDERDLVLSTTRGAGSDGESTVSVFYDGNRNTVRVDDAEDTDGDGLRDRTLSAFDGFDRQQRLVSAVGTETALEYDPASQVLCTCVSGAPGGASPVGNDTSRNERLAEGDTVYDEVGRAVRRDQQLFVNASASLVRAAVLTEGGPLGNLVPGDGNVNTATDFDRLGRVAFTVTDDEEVTQTFWDGASRAVRVLDAENNEVLSVFDDNSNAIRVTEIDRSQVPGVPDEQFVTIRVFDSLNRLQRETDNAGQTQRFVFDSRDNLRRTVDAQGPIGPDPLGLFPGLINLDGNTSDTAFDGINRVLAVARALRVGGQGGAAIDTSSPSNPDGHIAISQVWDRNSNLLSVADDDSNTTSYQWDELNRKVRETFADSTTNLFALDRDDNVRGLKDENGSVHSLTFDGANRLLQRDVNRAAAVVGTAVQRFEWDGLGRQTKSVDENIPGVTTDDASVTYTFDSLSRLLEEVQNGQPMSHRWSADDDKTACVYPDGRVIARLLDRLDRIDELTEGGGGSTRGGIGEPVGQLVARYRYLGIGRVATRRSGNGTELTFLDDAGTADVGYDLVRRVVRLRHRTLGPAPTLPPQAPPGAAAATTTAAAQVFADFGYAHNRMNYRTAEIRHHQNAGEGDVWRYDSVYRVTAHVRDVRNPLAELASPGTGGTQRENKSWQLDGLGNWDATVTNGGAPSAATNNEMNEYTAFGGVAQTHDDNGNLTDDGTLAFAYDTLNRMRSVTRKSDGALLALYSYDAHGLGRRVKRELTAVGAAAGLQQDGSLAHAVLYFYDGARVVEERVDNGSGASPIRQYVDGNGIDEHLQLFLLSTRKAYWYHEDAKGWVAALTKPNGNLEERRVYDTYGAEEIQDASGQVQASRFASNVYGYHSRRLDPESGLLYFRARQYHPVLGRFIQRDPKRAQLPPEQASNPYAFVDHSPASLSDPSGADAPGCDEPWGPIEDVWSKNCQLECCAAHDRCYDVYGCTQNSWLETVCRTMFSGWMERWMCGPGPESNCSKCNSVAAGCILKCKTKWRFSDPDSPKYYDHTTNEFYNLDEYGNKRDVRTADPKDDGMDPNRRR